MEWIIDQQVHTVGILTNPSPRSKRSSDDKKTIRRRMGAAERERQLLDGAIEFFSIHGFGGQLRDLARSMGVTHTLLYHYFPTKQALIDRVYLEVFEGKWRSSWDDLLDDPMISVEDKFVRFYLEYVNTTLSKEFVRILVFSGLTDHSITDRFFALLRKRLFPKLIRETRLHQGVISLTQPNERELELLMGLHGGFFYVAMRRWIYVQDVYADKAQKDISEVMVRDRVRGYLVASQLDQVQPPNNSK